MRVLQMLRELPRGKGCAASTARALAERFGVSERTIYRDMALIGEAGFALGNDGQGYYLLATDQTIPVELSSDELAGLVYAAGLVSAAMPGALAGDLTTAIGKLTAACGSDEAVRAALSAEAGLEVRPHLTDGPRACRNLQVAVQARRRQRCLQGLYHSPETDRSTRRVLHPYAITYRGEAHYLVAYCELRRAVRTFRLDRFRELTMLDRPANIPEHYDLEEHFAGAWAVTGGRRQRVRLRLRGLAARRLASAQVQPDQVYARTGPDEATLVLHVALTEEFRSWVLSLGAEAEVLAPRRLRREVAEVARGILANYSSP